MFGEKKDNCFKSSYLILSHFGEVKESGLKTKMMSPHHHGHKYPQTVMYMQKLQFKSNVINWTSRIFLLTHTYVIIIKKLNWVFTSSPSTHSLAIKVSIEAKTYS